jgi:hypothetical protein
MGHFTWLCSITIGYLFFLVNEVFMNHMNQLERMNNQSFFNGHDGHNGHAPMKQLPGYPPLPSDPNGRHRVLHPERKAGDGIHLQSMAHS